MLHLDNNISIVEFEIGELHVPSYSITTCLPSTAPAIIEEL